MVADLPWGRLGLTICYDLRFPTLHRALAEAGASFIASPAAFTKQTGEAHWHVLLRARAIENTAFVFAAAQGGRHEDGRDTFGHSLVIDPWGRILAEGGTEPGVVMAKIDPAEVATRAGADSLAAARPALRDGRAAAKPVPSARGRRLLMIRYALACVERPHLRELVPEFRGLRQAGEARAGRMPALRRQQGREGADGADAVAAPRSAAARRCRLRCPTPAAAPAPSETPTPVAMMSPEEREFRAKLKELRDHLTKNADNVGRKFPEEARKMHYGETEHRSIYGEASPEEAKDLHRGRHRISSAAGAARRAELGAAAQPLRPL